MPAALPPNDFRDVAEIRGPGSSCTVHWRQWDQDGPEPISVSCGKSVTVIDRDYHGFEAARLSTCRVLVLTQSPSLKSVDNCAGKLRMTDLGARWEAELLKKKGIKASRIDRQFYSAIKGKLGCYRITLLYPHRLDPKGSSYDSIQGDFCAPPLASR